jgi:hypothetical protein
MVAKEIKARMVTEFITDPRRLDIDADALPTLTCHWPKRIHGPR